MKPIHLVAALLLSASFPTTASNFCAVTSFGASCHFPSLESCQQSLVGVGGQCVANPAVLPQPVPQVPSQLAAPRPAPVYRPTPLPIGNIFEGAERGARAGREQQEHKARLELLRAQTRAAEAAATAKPFDWGALEQKAKAFTAGTPIYSCDGRTTDAPAVGCIVIGFANPP